MAQVSIKTENLIQRQVRCHINTVMKQKNASQFFSKHACLLNESFGYGLEPRVLLDAAAAGTAMDAIQGAHDTVGDAEVSALEAQDLIHSISTDIEHAQKGEAEALAPSIDHSGDKNALLKDILNVDTSVDPETVNDNGHHIVIVDANVEDIDKLRSGLNREADFYILNSQEKGLEQIAKITSKYGVDSIASLHIVSHGSSGKLSLGSGAVSFARLSSSQKASLEAINQRLASKGDILIYGCEFGQGEKGRQAVSRLASLTDTMVAASDDATGAISLGGDWYFEVNSADILGASSSLATGVIFNEAVQADYGDLLGESQGGETSTSYDSEAVSGGLVLKKRQLLDNGASQTQTASLSNSPVDKESCPVAPVPDSNHIPVLTGVSEVLLQGGQDINIRLTDYFTDQDGDLLDFYSPEGFGGLSYDANTKTLSGRVPYGNVPNIGIYARDSKGFYSRDLLTLKVTGGSGVGIGGDTRGSVTEDVNVAAGDLLVTSGDLDASFALDNGVAIIGRSGGIIGHLDIDESGQWKAVFNNGASEIQSLQQGESQDYSVQVTSVDGRTQEIILTVYGRDEVVRPDSNHIPVLTGVSEVLLQGGQDINIRLTDYFTDQDGDLLDFYSPEGFGGLSYDANTKTLSGRVPYGNVPNIGIYARDSKGFYSRDLLTLKVTGGSGVGIGGDTRGSVTEDVNVAAGDLLVTSGDLDASFALDNGVAIIGRSGGIIGHLDIDESGQWKAVFNNGASEIQSLQQGESQDYSVQVTSVDGRTQEIILTVYGRDEVVRPDSNHIPVLTGVSEVLLQGGQDINIRLTDYFTDQDGDLLDFYSPEGFGGLSYDANTKTLSGRVPYGNVPNIGIYARDSKGFYSRDLLTLKVTGGSGVGIGGDTRGSVTEDVNVAAGDLLVTSGDLDASFALDNGVAIIGRSGGIIGHLDIDESGQWKAVFNNGASEIQSLQQGESQDYSVQVTSVDGRTQEIILTVYGRDEVVRPDSNHIPVLTGVSEVLLQGGQDINIRLTDYFTDQDGDLLDFYSPEGFGGLSYDANTKTLSGRVPYGNVPNIGIYARDSKGFYSRDLLTLKVTGGSGVGIGGDTRGSVTEDVNVAAGDLLVTSGDLDASFALDNGVAIIGRSGGIIGHLDIDESGQWKAVFNNGASEIQSLQQGESQDYSVQVTSVDGRTQEIILTVYGRDEVVRPDSNHIPVLTGVSEVLLQGGQDINIRLTDYFTDQDGDLLDFYSPEGFGGLSYDANTKTLSGRVPYGNVPNIGIYARDSKGFYSRDLLTLKVTGGSGVGIGGDTRGSVTEDVNVAAGDLLVTSGDLDASFALDNGVAIIGRSGGIIGHLDIDESGQWKAVFNNGASEIQSLQQGESQDYSVQVTSVDGRTQEIILTVYGRDEVVRPDSNHIPVLTGVSEVLLQGGQDINIRLTDYFTDQDGDLLDFYSPEGFGELSYDANTKTLSGRVPYGNVPNIGIYARDSKGFYSRDLLTLKVTGGSGVGIGGDTRGSVTEDVNVAAGDLLVTSGDLDASFALDNGVAIIDRSGGIIGHLDIDESGQWKAVFNNGASEIQSLQQGESQDYSVQVTSVDGRTQEIILTVYGRDEVCPPIAGIGGDTHGSVTEDVNVAAGNLLVTSGVLDASFALDNGVAIIGRSGGIIGHLDIDESGQWKAVFNNGASEIQSLQQGESQDYSVQVTSVDGRTQEVIFTVYGTNEGTPPVITGKSDGIAEEDGVLRDQGHLNSGNGSLFDVVSNQSGQNGYGSFSIDADGNWVYNLDNNSSQVQELAEGEVVKDQYTFRTEDGRARTVKIIIIGANDVPMGAGRVLDEVIEVCEPWTRNLRVTDLFYDIDSDDNSESLIYKIEGLPEGIGYHYDTQRGLLVMSGEPTEAGIYTIKIIAIDRHGAEASKVFTLDITQGNNKCDITGKSDGIAEEDGVLRDQGHLNSGNGSLFDVVSNQPGQNGYGSFSIDADGNWVYNLDNNSSLVQGLKAGEKVTDSYTFKAADGRSRTVEITITGENDPTMTEGSIPAEASMTGERAHLDTSGYFTDIDHDPLSYTAIGLPPGLQIDPSTGLITGTVLPSALGKTYRVQVQATDGMSPPVTQEFVWTIDSQPGITGKSDGIAEEDGVLRDQGHLNSGNGSLFDVVSNQPGQNGYGSFSIDADGNWVYNLDNNSSLVQGLKAGEKVTDSYTFKAADGRSRTVEITITGENDPTMTEGSIPAEASMTGERAHLDTSGYFTDIDHDPLSYTAIGLPPGLQIDPSTGLITGTVLPSALGKTYRVQVQATDGMSPPVTQEFVWTIDSQPGITGKSDGIAEEDGVLRDQGHLNSGNGSLFDVVSNQPGQNGYGSFSIDADGNWVYNLDNNSSLVQGLKAGEKVTDSYTFKAADGRSRTVEITITGENDPTMTEGSIPAEASMTGERAHLDTSGYFTDIDHDPLSYTAIGLPPGLQIDPSTGLITGTVLPSALGKTYRVQVQATDGMSPPVTQEFVWTIDSQPGITGKSDGIAEEDGVLRDQGHLNSGNGSLFDVVSNQPGQNGYGSFSIDADGNWVYNLDNNSSLVQGLKAGEKVTDSYTFKAADGRSRTVEITITGENDPTMTEGSIPAEASMTGERAHLDTSGYFTDIDHDPLSYTAIGLPPGLQIDPSTGLITGTVLPSALGKTYRVQVQATDGMSPPVTQEFVWTIDSQPGITGKSDGIAEEDGVLRDQGHLNSGNGSLFDVVSNQPGQNGYGSFSIDADGNWVYNLDNNSSLVQGLKAGEKVTDSYTFKAADGRSRTVEITITGENDPTMTEGSIPAEASMTGERAHLDTSGYFTDIDHDPLSYTAIGLPPGLQIDPSTGLITGTVLPSALGKTYRVQVQATDGMSPPVTQEFVWTIDSQPGITGKSDGIAEEDGVLRDQGHLNSGNGSLFDVVSNQPGQNGYGSFSIDADGNWVYNLDNNSSLVQGLKAGEKVTDSYTFKAADGRSRTVEITITGENDPTMTEGSIPAEASMTGERAHLDTSGYFTDIDHDPLSYTAIGLPPGLQIDPSTGLITGTVLPSALGKTYRVQVQATDGMSPPVTQEFVWTIDSQPGITGKSDGIAEEDGVLRDQGHLNSGNGSLFDVVSNQPGQNGYGSFSIDADGNWVYNLDNNSSLVQGLAEGEVVKDQYTFKTADGRTKTIVMTIIGENDPTQAKDTIPEHTSVPGGEVTVDISGSFIDPDKTDQLTYTATGLPPGLTINPITGIITGVVDPSVPNGEYHVEITATDGKSNPAVQTFIWDITDNKYNPDWEVTYPTDGFAKGGLPSEGRHLGSGTSGKDGYSYSDGVTEAHNSIIKEYFGYNDNMNPRFTVTKGQIGDIRTYIDYGDVKTSDVFMLPLSGQGANAFYLSFPDVKSDQRWENVLDGMSDHKYDQPVIRQRVKRTISDKSVLFIRPKFKFNTSPGECNFCIFKPVGGWGDAETVSKR